MKTLLFFLVLSSSFLSGQSIELQARSVPKGHLPEGFPVEVMEEGFAVIDVTVNNTGEAPVEVAADLVQAWSPGQKKLVQVPSTRILPKLAKFYRAGGAGMAGQVYSGGPPTTGLPAPARKPTSADRDYSAIITQQLKVILDGYRLKQRALQPGESIRGFIYVKSRHRGPRLAGGRVALADATAVIE